MSKLVIVESPAKAKTISKYLGKDYVVKASMGHLRDLPKQKMSVDIENNFKPEYKAIEGKDKIIKELRGAAKDSEFVYLATDPDREGEAISWHLKTLLGLNDENSKRVTFNEITKKGVTYGIEHPRNIDEDLVNAQQARRILDRIVGYKLSPFLWRKIKRGLSAGRVQSVATRMVVDREREIRAFVPEEYWSIDAVFSKSGKHKFSAYFYGDETGKRELHNEEETNQVLDAVKDSVFAVSRLKKGQKKKSPPPPFTTSTLQQEASRKLGMTPKRTMSVAQELYEGVEIEGLGLTGLITYMRTDSLRLSAEALADAKEEIIRRYGAEYYPQKARVFRTKKGAQDAHEAIRPAQARLSPEDVKNSLSRDQLRLYKLIWSRFIACQMAEAVMDTVTADLSAEGYLFRATGFVMRFAGFTAVYEETSDEEKAGTGEKPLPALAEGETVTTESITPNQHFTQPPARYTEASLIKAMEEKGIGRPSTYAPTISTILDRDYVEKDKKALRPTPLGEGVTDLMVDKFKSVSDLKFTANMEDKLDEVEQGKVDYIRVLQDFYDDFETALNQAEKDLEKTRIKIKDEETDVVCELCGRKMVIKSGRFGKFLACPGFPECKNTKPIAEETPGVCPLCGGKILKKKSQRGFAYYGCEKHPACTFMTWDVPTKEFCPKCGGSIFKHTDRDSKEVANVCLKEGCGYKEILKEGLPPEEAQKVRERREARAQKMAETRAKKEAEKLAAKEAEKARKKEEREKAKKAKAEEKAAAKKAKTGKTAGKSAKTSRKKAEE